MKDSDVIGLCERLDGLSLTSLTWADSTKVMVVHDVIRDQSKRCEHFTFMRDRIQDGLIGIEWMRPARFAESTDQHGIGRFEEPQFRRDSRLILQLLENCGKVVKIFAFADVDNDGSLGCLSLRFQNEFAEFGE